MGRLRKLSPEQRRQEKRELYDDLAAGKVSVADAVRRMRRITGLTQPEFARRVAGISPGALAQIERGTGNPTLATLQKIGRAFGLSLGFVRSRLTQG